MWLAIWGVFAAFVVAFVGWTAAVLWQQKRTWAAFARKHKLTYTPGRMMDSPSVTGEFGKWKISLFSAAQQTPDGRGQRFVTVIEFQLGKGMPTGAAIATKEFKPFINGLIFDRDMIPDIAEWKKEYVARARDLKGLRAYFTKDRQQVLASLFAMKNATALFFFDEIEAVLRIETADPLNTDQHLQKIVQRLSAAVEKLAPTEDEKKEFRKLLAEEKKRRADGTVEEDDESAADAVPAEDKKEQPAAEPAKDQE